MQHVLGSIRIGDQTSKVTHLLLRVPAKRVTIDAQTCLRGFLHKILNRTEIHCTVGLHHRGIFKSIAGYHLVEVGLGQSKDLSLLIEWDGRSATTQDEIGVFHRVDIIFQRCISIQAVLGHGAGRLVDVEAWHIVVGTTREQHG